MADIRSSRWPETPWFCWHVLSRQDSNRDLKQQLVAANSTAKVCSVFGLEEFYNGIEHVPYANTLNYHKYIDLE